MTVSADEVAAALVDQRTLHTRVHPVFLPLSIRQNRIEDVFLDFLGWLRPDAESDRGRIDRTGDARARFIMSRLEQATDRARVPTLEPKRQLLADWIRSELIVDPRSTNRTGESAVSIMPLHSAVALYFDPPGQPPAYGRFISELLTRTADGLDFGLLERLGEFFDVGGGDPVARILEAALAEGTASDGERRFRQLAEPDRQVWACDHAHLFREQIDSALDVGRWVGRRAFVDWLYAIATYFVATYFLRLARAAEAYSGWLESRLRGEREPWTASLDDVQFAPAIPYSHRDESHSRLLKRLPFFTSQAALARKFVEATGGRAPAASDLAGLGEALSEALERTDSEPAFEIACDRYPTKPSDATRSRWKLEGDDKAEILSLARASGVHPFVVLSQHLNFEDMSRSSNNVMEWQFYSSLARNARFGFARRGRTGEVLRYTMSEPLLVSLVHCHVQQEGDGATLESFVAFLGRLGFVFDGDGRAELEYQLLLAGLLDALADASDAKYLRPTYREEAPA